jgi:hypothetical protein
MGDRMDNAQERNFRRHQSKAALKAELDQARAWDRDVKIAKHNAKMNQKYK